MVGLAPDADDRLCGGCRFNVRDHSNHIERYCLAFEVRLVSGFGIACERAAECRARERTTERLIEVSPEDAALLSRVSHAVSQGIENDLPGYAAASDRLWTAVHEQAARKR